MDDLELQQVEEMITIQLIPEINKLIRIKNFNAKLTGASTDANFLYIDLLVDRDNSPDIIKVEMSLDKNTLYSRGCCSEVDKWGNFADKKDQMTLATLVKLRVLRLVFSAIKTISSGGVRGGKDTNKVNVAFGDKMGALWYY